MQPARIKNWAGCEGGVAALEFGLVAPFLILLLLGGFEVSRYILVVEKVEKVAFSIADVAAQYDPDEGTDVGQVFAAVEQIMSPFAMDTEGRVILSSVFKPEDSDQPQVRWQCANDGGLDQGSKVGAVNGPADMPGNFLVDDKDNIIVAEVFYRFQPVMRTVFTQPVVIYRSALFRPRLGALTSAPGC